MHISHCRTQTYYFNSYLVQTNCMRHTRAGLRLKQYSRRLWGVMTDAAVGLCGKTLMLFDTLRGEVAWERRTGSGDNGGLSTFR